MKPKVSIVVPVYNVERYLDRCLNSLVNQTLKDIEIILVDDGSPDNCHEMCDEWAKKDTRIKVIHKNNEGLGYARNSGLDIATGKYVAFVDSDDYVDLSMYEIMYNYITNYNADTTVCNYKRVANSGKTSDCIIDGFPKNGHLIIDGLNEYVLNVVGSKPDSNYDQLYGYAVWNVLFSMSIIERFKLHFESEREFVSEDVLFQIDYFSKVERVQLISDKLYYYCQNAGSLTQNYNANRFTLEVDLFKEIELRMQHLNFSEDDWSIRTKRLLMMKAKFSVCDSIKGLSFFESINAVKNISINLDLSNVLSNYPISRMTIYNKTFYFLLKNKMSFIIVLLYRITH